MISGENPKPWYQQKHKKNMNELLSGTNKSSYDYFEEKLIKDLVNIELPFTRLSAKP